MSNENNPMMLIVPVGTHIASATETLPAMSALKRYTVRSVKVMNEAALTADDTNNRVLTLRKVGGNDIAVLTTDVAGGGLVANVGKALVLSATPANLLLAALDDLELDLAVNGSGGALANAILQIELIVQ